MSVLSITAPQFTVEDERLEQETYTEEELQCAERDLFGIPQPPSEIERIAAASKSANGEVQESEELNNVLEEFHQALEDIPFEEKEAYIEALDRVPQLIELESHPITFLKSTGYHAWGAAERLVNYWELRKVSNHIPRHAVRSFSS